MKALECFLTGGCFAIAGHRFDPRTMRCTVVHHDGRLCMRSLNDVRSCLAEAKVGDVGVACVGSLNQHELDTLAKADGLIAKAIEAAGS